MSQQLVLTPLGIVTEPNKLGQIPAGALSSMTECVERSPGVIENMRSWATRATIPTDAGTTAAFLIATPGPYMLVVFNVTAGWKYCWFDQTSGAQLFGGAQNLNFARGPTTFTQSIPVASQPGFTYAIVGQQIFLNTYSNVLVWDTYTPTSTLTATPRPAGMPVPNISDITAVTGVALAANTYAHYVAIAKRTVGDKVIVSAPSAAISNPGTGTASASQVVVKLGIGGGFCQFNVGDTIELYRTVSKPSGVASAYADFQRGEEAGSEYRKATSYVLTADDVDANSSSTIVDNTPDTSLGEALYTNQAIAGSAAAASIPPAVELLTAYKGYLFGFGVTRTPSLLVRPTGFWGIAETSMSSAQVASGQGRVELTGATYSNGGTTVTLSPTSQLAWLKPGMQVFGTGLTGQTITVVGGSSVTISPAASAAGSSVAISAFDVILHSVDGGAVQTQFIEEWDNLVSGLAGSSYNLLLECLSLKLPPYSASANVFRSQPTDGFTLSTRHAMDTRAPMTLQISRGDNWDPRIPGPLDTARSIPYEVKPADYVWSEGGAPESWPRIQRDTFARGTPCAVASTRDAIIAFYTDAIWRVSGTGGTAGKGYDWRADPIATNITANGSQVLAVLSDVVYGQTSDGFIGISDSAIQKITQGRVHDQLDCPPWSDGSYTASNARFTIADEEHNEILFREPSAANGRMWLYNTNTDRLAQTISHANPFHADYSRFLRLPLVIGRDGSTWTVKAQSGSYADCSMTYAPVYADNPFAQRHWQTLNVSVEAAGSVSITPTFNGVAGSSRTPGADGRCAFEVPRNAPAIGNTMQVGLTVTAGGNRVKLHGFSLDYRDHTDRRRNR